MPHPWHSTHLGKAFHRHVRDGLGRKLTFRVFQDQWNLVSNPWSKYHANPLSSGTYSKLAVSETYSMIYASIINSLTWMFKGFTSQLPPAGILDMWSWWIVLWHPGTPKRNLSPARTCPSHRFYDSQPVVFTEWEIQKCQTSVAYPGFSVCIWMLHSSTPHLINHFFHFARFRLRLCTCLATKPGNMSFRDFLVGSFWAKIFEKCQNYADTAINRFISYYDAAC